MKALENILAVLVLYNCRIEESTTFLSLDESLACFGGSLDLLVYDNSPVRGYEQEPFMKGNMRIIYVSDVHNSGVSQAYNTGWEFAKKLGKKWMLLLDQDTLFPLHSIEGYVRQMEKGRRLCAPLLSSGDLYLSPCGYWGGRGWALKHVELGEMDLRGKSVLNSGLMIHLEVFENVGGYNVNIPLDFSDHEWLERVKRHYKTIYVMNVTCKHSLSVAETDVRKVLVRFKYYLKGAREYRKTSASFALPFFVFLRTIKLSFRFKTVEFLCCYFAC